MSQLIFVEQRPMQGKEHVPQSGAVIGREGSDFNLADPEVSRRHAAVHVEGDTLSIEDLGSTNGTFVNGQQIQGTRQLAEGDEVRFGNTVWKVQPSPQVTAAGEAPGAPPTAAPPQVTAARQVPDALPPEPQAPPAPPPPTPAQPAAQQPAAPAPPAPAPPAPTPPTAQQPAAPRPPAPAGGARGDVPAPDFQPSAIRRVVPPPGGPTAFQQQTAGRPRGSAATRLGATVLATIAVALTAAAVVAYYVIEPFEPGGTADVEDVIITYGEAFADADGDTACDQLTEEAQEDLVDSADGFEGDCAELVTTAANTLNEEQKDELREVEPTDVQIDGDTATASVEGDGDEDTVELVREDGDWKITDPGN